MKITRCKLLSVATKPNFLYWFLACTWFSYEMLIGTDQPIETLLEYKAMIMKQQFLSKQSNKIDAFGNDVYDI